jgi:hypothetical protein
MGILSNISVLDGSLLMASQNFTGSPYKAVTWTNVPQLWHAHLLPGKCFNKLLWSSGSDPNNTVSRHHATVFNHCWT